MKKIDSIVLILWLAIGQSLLAQVDRTKAPLPAPAPKIQFGEAARFDLSNGLKVFVVENHRIPKVSYSFSFIFDPELEGENSGIGELTGDLIGTGTNTRTKDQINEDIDFMGAAFSASADGIYASSLKKYTGKLLEILSDIVIHSVFNKEELEKKRTQVLSDLESNKDDPNSIARNVFSSLIYGKNYPYGEFETERSVKNVTLEMCTKYYTKYFIPNISYVTIIGDITPAEAKLLMEKYFGDWQKKDIEFQHYPVPQAPQVRRVALVDRPQSVQSVIQLGYPVDLKISSPDYIKSTVTNMVLGGGEFRLFLNLREKHGYTYGAYSSFSIHPLISSFKVNTSVRNVVTDSSITQILYEMNRLREEPVTTEELVLVKNYMTGNFALSLENPRTIATFAVNTERYKLPADFYTNYLKDIEAVTVKDIQEMAIKYIKPDQSTLLVVGKASVLGDKLRKFSPEGTIETYDIDANPYNASEKVNELPAGITSKSVLNRYIQAIGGVDKIEKIKDMTIKATVSIQGNLLNLTLMYKLPGIFLSVVTMNGETIQKVVLKNENAKVSDMQSTHEAEGMELEKLIIDACPVPELDYEKLGYKAKLIDISDIDSVKAYQVEITSPLGNSSIDYFRVDNGLKIRSVSATNGSASQITQTTNILEYLEVHGIKFPKKMTQRMGSQLFDISVESISLNTILPDEIFH